MSRRSILAIVVFGLTIAACGSSTSPSPAAPSVAPAVSQPSVATSAPAASAEAAIAAPCLRRALKFDPTRIDLTGAWTGNDQGVYYIRQVGKTVWWSGMSGQTGTPDALGRDWNNVATGQIKDDLTIALDWADVPRGQILGGGTLVWKIQDDGTGNIKLTKVSETGSGFGGEVFTPCGPG